VAKHQTVLTPNISHICIIDVSILSPLAADHFAYKTAQKIVKIFEDKKIMTADGKSHYTKKKSHHAHLVEIDHSFLWALFSVKVRSNDQRNYAQ